jgi:cob(I)alamin adenosyltransferase
MTSKIYTKKGDKGQTSLIGGSRVPKDHLRIESYGTIDELNSFIGLLHDAAADEHARVMLKEIQDRLFTIGSSLASDTGSSMRIPDLHKQDIQLLEKEMDQMNDALPPMKSFVLPGGHATVSAAHIARCVCRRAERCCVHMQENGLPVEPLVLEYLNRLSDYLFVLARHIAWQLKAPEITWKPRI